MERTITVNGINYRLESVTGKVLDTTKSMETSVQGSVSGGGGRLREGSGKLKAVDLNMVSTTIVYDQFFLQDDAGREHSFQLQGFNVACRAGNSLTVTAAFKTGQQRGPYVAVRNNSTNVHFVNDKVLRSLCSPNMLLYLLACLGAIILEYKILSGFFLITGCMLATMFGTMVVYGIKSETYLQDFKKNL